MQKFNFCWYGQFVAGGIDTEPKKNAFSVEACSFEDAVNRLTNILLHGRDNCFDHFGVALGEDRTVYHLLPHIRGRQKSYGISIHDLLAITFVPFVPFPTVHS